MKTISLLLALASTVSAQPRTGRILVANQQSASATIIELATGAVSHLSVGLGPHEAAISPDGKWGFVTVYGVGGQPGNQVAVIDMAEKKVVRHIDLGGYTRPHGVVPIAGSPLKLMVTSEATQNIVLVDAEKGSVLTAIPTGAQGSHMVSLSVDATRAYTANVGSGTMTAFDLTSGKTTGSVAIGPRSEGLASNPAGTEVWVGSNELGTVSLVNVAAMKVEAVIPGFAVPYRLAVSPDGKVVAVCEAGSTRIGLIDAAARKSIGAVDVGGSPRGVFVSPDSKHALVTLGPENAVVIIDLGSKAVVGRFAVQTAPDGVAYSPR